MNFTVIDCAPGVDALLVAKSAGSKAFWGTPLGVLVKETYDAGNQSYFCAHFVNTTADVMEKKYRVSAQDSRKFLMHCIGMLEARGAAFYDAFEEQTATLKAIARQTSCADGDWEDLAILRAAKRARALAEVRGMDPAVTIALRDDRFEPHLRREGFACRRIEAPKSLVATAA